MTSITDVDNFDDLEEFAFSVTPELGKSEQEQRDRIIYLKAATEDLDLEEEITKSSAISESLPYFWRTGSSPTSTSRRTTGTTPRS